jgi:transcriptional regulator
MLAEARRRRARALKLYERGKTTEEVGVVLGVTKQRASELIRRARLERGSKLGAAA